MCDFFSMASFGKSTASAAGFNFAAFKHNVYAFPNNACGGLGAGTTVTYAVTVTNNGKAQLREPRGGHGALHEDVTVTNNGKAQLRA